MFLGVGDIYIYKGVESPSGGVAVGGAVVRAWFVDGVYPDCGATPRSLVSEGRNV